MYRAGQSREEIQEANEKQTKGLAMESWKLKEHSRLSYSVALFRAFDFGTKDEGLCNATLSRGLPG